MVGPAHRLDPAPDPLHVAGEEDVLQLVGAPAVVPGRHAVLHIVRPARRIPQVDVTGDDDLRPRPRAGQDRPKLVALPQGHVRVGGQVRGTRGEPGFDDRGTGPGAYLLAGVLAGGPATVDRPAGVVEQQRDAEQLAVDASVRATRVPVE